MIDKLLNKFRSHPKHDGKTVSLTTTQKFTERDLLERIKQCVNDKDIDKYNTSYKNFSRLLARDRFIINSIEKVLNELEKVVEDE